MSDPSAADRQWHLDKKVPLALIVTIILQTAGMVWWAASLNSDVRYLTDRVQRAETTLERESVTNRGISDRLIRVEEGIKAILEVVRRRDDDLPRR